MSAIHATCLLDVDQEGPWNRDQIESSARAACRCRGKDLDNVNQRQLNEGGVMKGFVKDIERIAIERGPGLCISFES